MKDFSPSPRDMPGAIARYSRPAIILHWLIAAGILCNLLLVWSVDSMPDSFERPMIDLHKSIGLTVLGLACMRLLWRLGHRPPALPPYPAWQLRLSTAVHWGLYAVMFLLPLTGWIHDSAWKGAAAHPLKLFWVIPWFRIGAIAGMDPVAKEQVHSLFSALHTSVAYVLYAMVALHIGGALKHGFIDRQPSLRRMW